MHRPLRAALVAFVSLSASLGGTLAPLLLIAQPKALTSEQRKKDAYEVTWGVYGRVSAGIAVGDFGPVTTALAAPEALTFEPTGQTAVIPAETFTMGRLGGSYGLHLGGIWRRKLVVEIGLGYADFARSATFKGQAWVRQLHVGGRIGYAVFNKSGWMLYPFVGYLSGTSQLRVENYFIDPISVGDVRIDRNGTAVFRATTGLVELGIGTVHLLSRSDRWMLGAEIGGYFSAGGDAWADASGRAPEALGTPQLAGAYLRVSFGGGLFNTTKPTATRRRVEDAPPVEEQNLKQLFEEQRTAPTEPKAEPKVEPKPEEKPVAKPDDKPEKKPEAPADFRRTLPSEEKREELDKRSQPRKKPTPVKKPKAKKPKKEKKVDTNYDESEFEKKQ